MSRTARLGGALLLLGWAAAPVALRDAAARETAPLRLPAPVAGGRAFPINLPTALRLSNVRPIDVAVASERIRLALARYQRARVLWVPSLQFGADYYRHDGRVQDVQGNLFDTDKSSVMLGAGPYAVFGVTDALFAPLAPSSSTSTPSGCTPTSSPPRR